MAYAFVVVIGAVVGMAFFGVGYHLFVKHREHLAATGALQPADVSEPSHKIGPPAAAKPELVEPVPTNAKRKPIRESTVKSQILINSPGAIQAGRDINIVAADRRIINSISLRMSVETETAPTTDIEAGTDIGLVSFVALFTRDKKRIRFESDGRILTEQLGPTRRKLSFVYSPETPEELLGKDITYLAEMDVLAVNYADIFKTEHFDTNNEQTSLHCKVTVNGVTVATLHGDVHPKGYLNQGRMMLAVGETFRSIPSVYAAAVSR